MPSGNQSAKTNIVGGILIHPLVKQNIFSNLSKGQMANVHAIIVHQTDTSTAQQTINSYKNGKNGAHFLIDKNGTIYQTANLGQKTNHVGKIKSKCYECNVCSKIEKNKVNSILFTKGLKYSKRALNLSSYEKTKPYPDRYPSNNDSIGIEIVGKFDSKSNQFESVNSAQNISLKWLVKELQTSLNLKVTDVYRHPTVSYKQPSEAATAVW